MPHRMIPCFIRSPVRNKSFFRLANIKRFNDHVHNNRKTARKSHDMPASLAYGSTMFDRTVCVRAEARDWLSGSNGFGECKSLPLSGVRSPELRPTQEVAGPSSHKSCPTDLVRCSTD